MKRLLKNSVLLAVVLVFCFTALSFAAEAAPAAAPAKPAAPKFLKVGDAMGDFTLPDGLGKGQVSFNNDIKGKSKIAIITFMTTACSACKAELNLLNDLANKYADDLKVYAIAVDLNGDKSVPNYDKTFGFNVRYMLDPDFKVPQTLGFTYTPSLVLIKDGKILFTKGGYAVADSDAIVAAVKDAIK